MLTYYVRCGSKEATASVALHAMFLRCHGWCIYEACKRIAGCSAENAVQDCALQIKVIVSNLDGVGKCFICINCERCNQDSLKRVYCLENTEAIRN